MDSAPAPPVDPSTVGQTAPEDGAAEPTPLLIRRSTLARATNITVLLVVGLYGAWWAQPILVPVLLAILLALVLAPSVRWLCTWRVPRSLSALLVLGTVIGVIGGLGSLLIDPATAWAERAPRAMKRLELRLSAIREPIEAASEATDQLFNGRAVGAVEPSATARGVSTLFNTVLIQTPGAVGSILGTLFLAFFLLVRGEDLLRKFVSLAPGLTAKKGLVAGTRESQRDLSRYLLMISLINIGLGAVTAAALWAIGFPDPLLWGGIAAILNFAPYLGALVTIGLLIVAGFAEYVDVGQALLPAAMFLCLTALEGQLVTPLAVGNRLTLDPVVIVLTLFVLGWLWGIPGLLLAVPMLAALRIFAHRVAPHGAAVKILTAG